MRVAVIGAGVIGVTTAYELAAQGLEVSVFERRGSVAEEASFANAGVVAPGYVGPWAAPGMTWRVIRHLLSSHAPVRFGGFNALRELPWMWRWWRACRPRVHAANRSAMLNLAQFSRLRLLELARDLSLEFEQSPGFTVLLRTERELAAAGTGLAILREMGCAHELMDAARCRQIEPGLNPDTHLHAAIHLPQDGVGNCRHFTHLLKSQAQRLGASFHFETDVLSVKAGRQPALTLANGEVTEFDGVVISAGVQSNNLLSGIGLRLPLAAVHGYSVTAPLRHIDGLPPLGPRSALMDERYKIAVTRLGQRIRISGGAELGGRPDHIAMAPLRTLYRVLDDWFAGAALIREAQHWKGARPMLPDGPPIVGESGAPGVWLNLGHGASGWALACGSARLLADRIAGREPPLDASLLSVTRLR
jgi:D-amino-acid dehydrogenase